MSVCCGHGIEGNCNEMKAVGNVIWLLFGGVFVAVEYLIASIGLMLTIVGIPFGLQSLKLVQVALWPFGKSLVPGPAASGCLSLLMNVIWFFLGGLPIALTHLFFGLLLCITIVGIPFAKQHFKLMKLAFAPFGKRVVSD